MVTWIKKVSYNEMVGYWVRHEYLGRPGYDDIARNQFPDTSFILKENYDDPIDNEKRLQMLNIYHGYVLQNFPKDLDEWWLATLNSSDLEERLLLIDAADQRYLSNGTLKPFDYARRISQDKEFPIACYRDKVDPILASYTNRARENSRIIIVGPKDGPWRAIDGNTRLVSIFLYHWIQKHPGFKPREAYVGLTKEPFNFRF